VCGAGNAAYAVNVGKTCDFNGAVTLSANGIPAGAQGSFSANPVTPPGSSTLPIGPLGGVAPGTYNITIVGTDGSITRQDTVVLNVSPGGAPGAPVLASPADGSTGVSTAPSLAWNAVNGAATYDVQVATDAGFGNVVRSATGLTGTSYTPSPALSEDTLYYWRVRANNACGTGSYSAAWSFRTLATTCITQSSTDVPRPISDRTTVESTLAAADALTLTDVNVTIGRITHTADGDLDIYLVAPDGTVVELSTDNGGTGDNYVSTVLDDEAATLITAVSAPFTGSFRPEGSLATLDGRAALGTWRLRIYDDTKRNTGSLVSWSLTVCGAPAGY
jgi:subtilisin-like proprotein convertase family protein